MFLKMNLSCEAPNQETGVVCTWVSPRFTEDDEVRVVIGSES